MYSNQWEVIIMKKLRVPATSARLTAFAWTSHSWNGFWVIKSPVPLDVVGIYTAPPTDGEVSSMDVEMIQPRQVKETVKIGAAEPTKPGSGKRLTIPQREVLLTAKKNLNRCAAALPDFLVPRARNVWMIRQTIVTRPRGGADCAGICVK